MSVGPNMRNGPVYIMDVPTSILGRAVPVWMLGPVNYGLHLYGDRGLLKFLDSLGVFFLFYWRHATHLTLSILGVHYLYRDFEDSYTRPSINSGRPVLILDAQYTYWMSQNWCDQYWYWTRPVYILGVQYWCCVKIIANKTKGRASVMQLSIWGYYLNGPALKNPSIDTGRPKSELISPYWK